MSEKEELQRAVAQKSYDRALTEREPDFLALSLQQIHESFLRYEPARMAVLYEHASDVFRLAAQMERRKVR